MKLRNKKTGEILDFDSITDTCFGSKIQLQATKYYDKPIYIYNFLTELNEEWEDAPEEPKTHWNITQFGDVTYGVDEYSAEIVDEMKQIGNCFDTKEEAKQAVEKLKAWKRLKDGGFKFEGTNNSKRKTGYFINYYLGKSFNSQDDCEQAMKDLDLLFGGEE